MIKKRADFLAANRGKRYVTPGFILLAHNRQDESDARRLGITVTKKIGNAVVRNRMKRRFRALAAETFGEYAIDGYDHILIGRASGVERNFGEMRSELEKGLKKLAQKARESK